MKNLSILKKCPLFVGISEKDMASLIVCLNAKELSVQKGEVIFSVGDRPEYVGIVLEGNVHIVQEDYWGNRTILSNVQPGGLFGESFSCAEISSFPVSVWARDNCKVLLVDTVRILTTCSSACTFHSVLVHNLMKTLANKNIILTQKIKHITKKTSKDKVLSYLSECAVSAGTNTFLITFNRQELADYLSVERSALSSTLSKMRDEGLIDFDKNKFVLH